MATNNSSMPWMSMDPPTTQGPFVPNEDIISISTYDILGKLFGKWLCFFTSIIGLFANMICMRVFAKMGFESSINMSLMCIALLDFLTCFCTLAYSVTSVITLADPVLGHNWYMATAPSIANFGIYTSYAASMVTAYVAVERCLCILIPFDIKNIFTPKRTKLVVIILPIIVVAPLCIFLAGFHYYYTFSSELNATILDFRYSQFLIDYRDTIFEVYFNAFHSWPVLAFFILFVASVMMIVSLKLTVKSNDGKAVNTSLSKKEAKVSKMIILVVVTNLVCTLPRVFSMVMKTAFPNEYSFQGYYHLLQLLARFINQFTCTVNSTINMFIYLTMSTAFKETFLENIGFLKTYIGKGNP